MKLIRLGDYIQPVDNKNIDEKYDKNFVRGISTKKEFIETKANLSGVSLKGYKVVQQECFAYVSDTSRRGDKMSLAYNDTNNIILVSSISTVFKIINKNVINPLFLYMFFKRSEFDRYARFNSWGSARETFDWNDFCDIKIELPSIEIQNKYVAIYKAMQDNLKVYQNKLDDLKLTKEYLINNNKDKRKIGNLIEETSEKNTLGLYKEEKGVSINKEFIDTKAKSSDIKTQKVVNKNEFAFNSNTSRNSDTISIAYNEDKTYIVSNTYVTFKCKESELNPKYLFLWFTQKKFDRYARFNSWGSARETISLNEIKDYKISIPSMDVQNSIVAIYESYKKREKILNDITNSIRNICPILVKGAIQEGEKGKNE